MTAIIAWLVEVAYYAAIIATAMAVFILWRIVRHVRRKRKSRSRGTKEP